MGCAHGSGEANRQIDALLKIFPPSQVQYHLQSFASDAAVDAKLRRYFTKGPWSEDVCDSKALNQKGPARFSSLAQLPVPLISF